MSRRLVSITLDNLGDISTRCRRCVFWELDPAAAERAEAHGDTEIEKEAWVSGVLLEWGSCGYLIYVDGVAAGHVLFAPPAMVPRSVAFPTSPVSSDAVLLMSASIRPEFAGQGLGRMLVQGVARDMVKRGIKAVEAFGTARPTGADVPAAGCLLPVDFLLSVGFKTVRPHPRVPRLRLELRTTLSWKEDVEYAIERLLSTITPAPSPA